MASLVALNPHVTVSMNGCLAPLTDPVYSAHTNTVQACTLLVAVMVELPSSVQRGHDHLEGIYPLFRM